MSKNEKNMLRKIIEEIQITCIKNLNFKFKNLLRNEIYMSKNKKKMLRNFFR